jgi:hypothetical protein
MLFLVFITLFSFNLHAQNKAEDKSFIDPKINYQIDWQYVAGEYLIYDCQRSHYACVNKDGSQNCKEERTFAIETKAKSYPCVPLKKFETKSACVGKQYKLVDIEAKKRFCFPK